MTSLSAPYLVPLFLGMTFDARYSRPGIDIYDMKYVDDPVITGSPSTTSTYKIVNSMRDVRQSLGISGDLSLKIKAGMLNVEGKGSYLKNMREYVDTVEILTTLDYVSSVHTLKEGAVAREGWMEIPPSVLGTHYVSGITYGAQMVASLRFVVFNSSDTKEVKGAVNAAFGSGKQAVDLVAEGELENLQKSVQDKCNLEVSFYGTVPLKSIPNDIEGFRQLVSTFKEQVEEAGLKNGIPMEVQLSPLQQIADSEHQDKFKFLLNEVLEKKLADFEGRLDEMRQARLELTGWASSLPYHIDEEYEKEVGRLLKNITQVMEVFYDVIWKLDMTGGLEQLEPADNAYNYDGRGTYNRYHKLVTRLRDRLDPLIKRDEVAADTYIQWGNSNCTAEKTQVLYDGFAVSSTEEGIGGVAQYECAPRSPGKGYELDNGATKSNLAGIRYTKLEKSMNPFLGPNAKKIAEKGVPCAKCYTPDSASVVMIPASDVCPLTWAMMYSGFLMSSREGGHTTQYVCVDDTPSAGYKMDAVQNARDTLALSVVKPEGSLPSGTYVQNALIQCVVCAMKSNQASF